MIDTLPVQMEQRIRTALMMLWEAWQYAKLSRVDPWQYAEEHRSLSAAAVTNADLRWLLHHELVQHAREVTSDREQKRVFRPVKNTTLPPGACFLLTDAGLALSRRLTSKLAQPKLAGNVSWCPERRELSFGSILVKRFRRPAANQEVVLEAFQESGWPFRIDDPLPCVHDLDVRQRLHDTIIHLNRNQLNRAIRFRGDGRGRGVCWEPAQAE